MKKTTLFLITITMIGGLCGAVESTGDEAEPEKACFRVRDVRSFEAVDDRFVYVRAVRGKHYLLTMENVCMGLEKSIGVAIANEFDRVCSNDRAMVTFKDFNLVKRCAILSVEAVADREAALVLIEKRRKTDSGDDAAKEEKKNAAPGETEGRR